MHPNTLIASAVAGVFVQSAWAEEPIKEQTLAPVVVTSQPFPDRTALDMTQPATVMRGDSLRRNQTTNLGDALDTEPGVQSSGFAAAAGRPIIRGLDGARVQVLNNGLGVSDVSTISPDHQVTADPFSARQIEVLRGPATILYGGAVGGVVNVVSDAIPSRRVNGLNGLAEVVTQSANNEIGGRARADGGNGPFQFALGGFIRNTSDYNIPGPVIQGDPLSGRGTLPNSYTRSEFGSGGVSYVGERGFIGANASILSSSYGLPGPEFSHIDLNQNRYDLAGAVDDPLPGLRNTQVKFGYNVYRHDEVELNGDIATTFRNTAYEGHVQSQHKQIAGFDGVFGLQYLYRDFSAVGEESFIQPVNQRNTGVFLVESYDFNERWRLDLGTRIDFNYYRPIGDSPIEARNFSPFSLSAGLLWKFADGYNAALNLCRCQRAPQIEELYPDGPHAATLTFDVGDQRLKTETANNIDLTFRKIAGDWQWSGTAYYTYFNDFIFASFVPGPDGRPVRVNAEGEVEPDGEFRLQKFAQASSATFKGLEGQVSYRPITPLVVRVFGDVTQATIDTAIGSVDAPRIGPARLGFDTNFKQGPWGAYLLMLGAFRQTRVAPLETETPGYVRLDAEVSYTLSRGVFGPVTLYVAGRNLLDQDIRFATSYTKAFAPQPGRSFLVGLRAQF
ncbi:MAG: TonB-dependent receptor [Burkholderiales bacterium]